jgi:protein-S-isoprenylcysteine O-methyltransferase Ste14
VVRRVDLGRLIVVPVVALLLASDLWRLSHRDGRDASSVLAWLTEFLVCAFFAMVIWFYLRRSPAVATTASVPARVAAVIATVLPFTIPLPAQRSGTGLQLAADVLLAVGAGWTLWSLAFLGRNVSIIAQARAVAQHGPYRWVRHPLYTGELISSLGLALTSASAIGFALWLVFCGLQIYRAAQEEQVLLGALPEYRDYRRRTAALLPGIF